MAPTLKSKKREAARPAHPDLDVLALPADTSPMLAASRRRSGGKLPAQCADSVSIPSRLRFVCLHRRTALAEESRESWVQGM